MTLDLGTLAVVLGISMAIRVAATTVLYVINSSYRGIGLWAMASACAAGAFALMFMRSAVPMLPAAAVFQGGLLVLAVLLEYLGSMAFLGRRPYRRLAWGGFAAFVAAMTFFTLAHGDETARTVFTNGALAAFTLWTAWNIGADKRASIHRSTRFMAAVFLLSGVYFAFRAISVEAGAGADSMVAPGLMQMTELLVALVEGNLLTYGLVIMVGQRLHAEADEARQRFELLFNTSPDASIITRLDDGSVVSVNDGFTAITGYSRDEIIGRSTIGALWRHPEDRAAVVALLVAHRECDNVEAEFTRKDGTGFVGIVSAKLLTLDGVTHAISVIRDITGRKALEDELTRRATTDGLTGVANRGRFMDLALSELHRAQRHDRPLSVVLLDIDRFKDINDTYGHLAGDLVLIAFAGVCQGIIRSIDVLARFGGDEFVLLLPETDAAGAREVAERIRAAFAAMTFPVDGHSISATACLGVGTLREGDESLDALIGRADLALYRAKESGRDRVEVERADA